MATTPFFPPHYSSLTVVAFQAPFSVSLSLPINLQYLLFLSPQHRESPSIFPGIVLTFIFTHTLSLLCWSLTVHVAATLSFSQASLPSCLVSDWERGGEEDKVKGKSFSWAVSFLKCQKLQMKSLRVAGSSCVTAWSPLEYILPTRNVPFQKIQLVTSMTKVVDGSRGMARGSIVSAEWKSSGRSLFAVSAFKLSCCFSDAWKLQRIS